VQLKNVSGADFYIYGHSADMPFVQTYMLDAEIGKWAKQAQGYCGTGAGLHRIARGATFMAMATFDKQGAAGGLIQLEFTRYPTAEIRDGVLVRTDPLAAKLAADTE
jgi:hypothetical protein